MKKIEQISYKTYELALIPNTDLIINRIDSDVDTVIVSGVWNPRVFGLFWIVNKENKPNISVLDFSQCSFDDSELYLNEDFPGLETIVFPRELNNCSFNNGSTQLKNILFPKTKNSISLSLNSNKVQDIVLPKSVEKLNLNYSDKSNLKSIKIGKKLKEINGDAFVNCPYLETVEISPENRYLTFVNNAIVNTQTQTLVAVLRNDSIKEITVPYGVKTIGKNAFKASPIEKITLPETLETIKESAFASCKSLVDVVIPDSVTTIEGYAFDGCTNLQTLKLSNSIKQLNQRIVIGCPNLKQLVLPEQLQSIVNNFFDNDSWKSWHKPDTPKQELQVILSENNNYYKVIDGILYTKDLKTLVTATNRNAKTYNIANGVEIIGQNAFENCENLEQIDLPDTVVEVSDYAFADCKNLTTIRFGKNFKKFVINSIRRDFKLKQLIITTPEPPQIIGDPANDYYCLDRDLDFLPNRRMTESKSIQFWNMFKYFSGNL